MKILVTGSRGFIGQAVGHEAARRGDTVVGLSRSAQAAPGWPGRHQCVDVIDGDLADILTSFAPDAIIHAAGPASVGESFHAPASTLKASLLSWVNVLDALRRSGVPSRALLISSAAVYGQPDRLPVAEGEVRRPISPYGYHKMMCEIAAQEYADCFGTDTVVGRLFSVVGPGQRRLLAWEVYTQLVDSTLAEVVLIGSPDSTRDYLHVQDVAVALLGLAHMASAPSIVNIASGTRSRVGEMATVLRDAVGATKPVRFLDRQTAGDPEHWQADISKLQGLLPNWQPRRLAAAVADCVAAWSSP
jgi:UDP-glucose 4-epimerase